MSLGRIHLTPQLVQAVRDTVDIVGIASQHTELKKKGSRYEGLCPLHKEKTPSFSVDPDRGLYYCFGCGAGGDAIRLHMQTTGDDFPAAIETLARHHGIPLPSVAAGTGRARQERDPEAALTAAAEYFIDQLRRSPGPREYLERRRVPGELIERFEIGYAPQGWRNLIEALHPTISLEELQAAGLTATSERGSGRPYDRFRDRLMFPIRTPAGRLVGFGGRAMGDDPAKYLNTNETERFQKGQLLYGLHLAKRSAREKGRVFLVEGYFDVVAAAACGITWTVASMGTALRPSQVRLLARYTDEVIVGYDGDTAGEEASRKALAILLAEGLSVRRARLPPGADPDSVRMEEGEEAVVRLVETAPEAVALELDRLVPAGAATEPLEQARAAEQVRQLLDPVRDPVLRYGYGRLASERLGLPAELLWKKRATGLQRGTTARGGGSDREVTAGRRLVLSLEERTLQLLLETGADLPALDELPLEEAFFDPVCRNIYATFSALYREGQEGTGENQRPEIGLVLSRLPGTGEAIDRVARVLLEEPSRAGAGELLSCLHRLRRRWQHQRLRHLAQEIRKAEKAGEERLLERLVEEKTALSRNLHRLP